MEIALLTATVFVQYVSVQPFYRAGWGPLGFFTSAKKAFMMSFEWQYAFTNGMNLEDQKAGYYALAMPESKLIVRDTITSIAAVDFKKLRSPLLFVAGAQDNTSLQTTLYWAIQNGKKWRNLF